MRCGLILAPCAAALRRATSTSTAGAASSSRCWTREETHEYAPPLRTAQGGPLRKGGVPGGTPRAAHLRPRPVPSHALYTHPSAASPPPVPRRRRAVAVSARAVAVSSAARPLSEEGQRLLDAAVAAEAAYAAAAPWDAAAALDALADVDAALRAASYVLEADNWEDLEAGAKEAVQGLAEAADGAATAAREATATLRPPAGPAPTESEAAAAEALLQPAAAAYEAAMARLVAAMDGADVPKFLGKVACKGVEALTAALAPLAVRRDRAGVAKTAWSSVAAYAIEGRDSDAPVPDVASGAVSRKRKRGASSTAQRPNTTPAPVSTARRTSTTPASTARRASSTPASVHKLKDLHVGGVLSTAVVGAADAPLVTLLREVASMLLAVVRIREGRKQEVSGLAEEVFDNVVGKAKGAEGLSLLTHVIAASGSKKKQRLMGAHPRRWLLWSGLDLAEVQAFFVVVLVKTLACEPLELLETSQVAVVSSMVTAVGSAIASKRAEDTVADVLCAAARGIEGELPGAAEGSGDAEVTLAGRMCALMVDAEAGARAVIAVFEKTLEAMNAVKFEKALGIPVWREAGERAAVEESTLSTPWLAPHELRSMLTLEEGWNPPRVEQPMFEPREGIEGSWLEVVQGVKAAVRGAKGAQVDVPVSRESNADAHRAVCPRADGPRGGEGATSPLSACVRAPCRAMCARRRATTLRLTATTRWLCATCSTRLAGRHMRPFPCPAALTCWSGRGRRRRRRKMWLRRLTTRAARPITAESGGARRRWLSSRWGPRREMTPTAAAGTCPRARWLSTRFAGGERRASAAPRLLPTLSAESGGGRS